MKRKINSSNIRVYSIMSCYIQTMKIMLIIHTDKPCRLLSPSIQDDGEFRWQKGWRIFLSRKRKTQRMKSQCHSMHPCAYLMCTTIRWLKHTLNQVKEFYQHHWKSYPSRMQNYPRGTYQNHSKCSTTKNVKEKIEKKLIVLI